MIMIRKTLLTSNRLSTAIHVPGRCIQVRLHAQHPYDLIAIYQHAWNASRGTQTLCTRRRQV